MVRVSKEILRDENRATAIRHTLSLLGGSKNSSAHWRPWEELITETELLQLAKRLGIILMLDKDAPTHIICNTLKVSTATVQRHARKLENGEYENIIRSVGKKRILKKLFREMCKVATYSLGPSSYVDTRKLWAYMHQMDERSTK
jgi:uncharacterized protein YerC